MKHFQLVAFLTLGVLTAQWQPVWMHCRSHSHVKTFHCLPGTHLLTVLCLSWRVRWYWGRCVSCFKCWTDCTAEDSWIMGRGIQGNSSVSHDNCAELFWEKNLNCTVWGHFTTPASSTAVPCVMQMFSWPRAVQKLLSSSSACLHYITCSPLYFSVISICVCILFCHGKS